MSAHLPSIDVDLCRRIADVLRGHEYSEEQVVATLGSPTATVSGVRRLGSMVRRTAAGRPLDTLIRLFIIGNRFDEDVLAPVLAPTTVDDWCALGILERVDAQVRAAISLRAFGGLFVVADIAGRPGGDHLRDDHVMGISPSTLGLARLTVRRTNRATLDLGAGGGYHALLAAAHSERVVATDLNDRAIWMAGLNAALNGINTIERRVGDLFAPVAGETFDLIVSNPPFIVGPDISQQFLSSEREGDGLCRELAGTAPAHLRDGGFCQFLANWISVEGQPWQQRVASWFEGSGCDVWVMRISSDRPDDYASTWISAMTDDPDVFEQRFARWMRFYDSVGADAIGLGLITMRRRHGVSNWRRFDDVPDAFESGSGDDIEKIVDVQTWAESVTADEVLASRFVVAPDARVVQQHRWQDGAWRTASMAFKRVSGLRFGGSIDEGAMQILETFDGTRSVRECVEAVVDSPPDQLLAGLVRTVPQLAARGLVERVP